MEAVADGRDDDSSVLVSAEGVSHRKRRGGRRKGRAQQTAGAGGGDDAQLTVHSHGLKPKQPTHTLQLAAGQGQPRAPAVEGRVH